MSKSVAAVSAVGSCKSVTGPPPAKRVLLAVSWRKCNCCGRQDLGRVSAMLRAAGFAVTLGVGVVFGFGAHAQISNNPYHVDYGWGQFQGRKIGVASGFKMDPDGKHLWMLDRCGANGCADSDLDPIIEVTLDGKFVKSFGKGQISFPHGLFVDKQGNW